VSAVTSECATVVSTPEPRVLCVCPFVPWPLDSGGRIRTFHLVREAHRQGLAKVELWCVADDRPAAELEQRLARELGVVRLFPRSASSAWQRLSRAKVERWFHSAALEQALAERLASAPPDLVHVDEMSVLRALPEHSPCPVLVHHSKLDVEFHTRVYGSGLAARFDRAKLVRLEAEAARRARHHVVCSDVDRALLTERRPSVVAHVVPSGFDPEHFVRSPDAARERDLVLVLGSLDYEPNVDGLAFLVEDVLPLLEGRVRVAVVGRNPSARVRALCRGDVHLVGAVDDVRPHLARAAVLAVPLRIGGGTRLKIAEALAVETAVVSTRIGAEGLPLDERHVWLADDARAFARALDEALQQPQLAAERAARGHAVATASLGWPSLARVLADAWRAAIEARGRASDRLQPRTP
jgi:glycosyltransferase involved in cell wall biosynthesis